MSAEQVVAMQDHLEDLIAAQAREVTVRLVALQETLDREWTAHRREHELMAEGNLLYRETLERRLDGMNALREQILHERGLFVDRTSYETRHEDVRRRLQIIENQVANYQGRFWTLAAVPSIVVVLVNFLIYYLSSHH